MLQHVRKARRCATCHLVLHQRLMLDQLERRKADVITSSSHFCSLHRVFLQHGIAVMRFTYLIHSAFIFTDKAPKERELNEALEHTASRFLLCTIKGFGVFD